MKLKDLAEITGLAVNNLSTLKTGKARAIRFTTLNAICKALDCTPGELIEFVPDETGPDYSRNSSANSSRTDGS